MSDASVDQTHPHRILITLHNCFGLVQPHATKEAAVQMIERIAANSKNTVTACYLGRVDDPKPECIQPD